jgi:hypothetical protein
MKYLKLQALGYFPIEAGNIACVPVILAAVRDCLLKICCMGY